MHCVPSEPSLSFFDTRCKRPACLYIYTPSLSPDHSSLPKRLIRNTLTLIHLRRVASRIKWVRNVAACLDGFSLTLLCLHSTHHLISMLSCEPGRTSETYKRKTTVCAAEDLRLVEVDEDAWVAKRTAAAVAGDDVRVDPADGLFVDELDGCEGAGLDRIAC